MFANFYTSRLKLPEVIS